MALDTEYTGPPIGEPPEHIHDVEPVTDAIQDAAEDVDELVIAVQTLESESGKRQTELLERIDTCRTQLEALSNRPQTPESLAESPMLVQIQSQLTQIQSEFLSLKSSLDTLLNRPDHVPNVSAAPIQETPHENAGDLLEVETVAVDNPQPIPPKKRIFV